jgi:hypothetical protein
MAASPIVPETRWLPGTFDLYCPATDPGLKSSGFGKRLFMLAAVWNAPCRLPFPLAVEHIRNTFLLEAQQMFRQAVFANGNLNFARSEFLESLECISPFEQRHSTPL